MSRTLAGLGLAAAVLSMVLAQQNCGETRTVGCGAGNVCTLDITNEAGKYVVNGKPPGGQFRMGFDDSIEWRFVNNTDAPIKVRLENWEPTAAGPAGERCPIRFTFGGVPGQCAAERDNIEVGGTNFVTAEALVDQGDANNPFTFNLSIGPAGGLATPQDPELQIDGYNFGKLAAIATGVLAALLALAAWMTRRRSNY